MNRGGCVNRVAMIKEIQRDVCFASDLCVSYLLSVCIAVSLSLSVCL